MAPRRPAKDLCPRTGITIPECSCPTCLEEQLRRHQAVGAKPDAAAADKERDGGQPAEH